MKMFSKTKKSFLSLAGYLAFVLLFAPVAVFGDRFLDDDLDYRFESGSTTQVYVSGLRNSSATHIAIPSTVEYEYQEPEINEQGVFINKRRTCSVVGIGESVFYGCSSLTTVTIPDSLKHIAFGAFDGCSGLTNVTIPSGVAIDPWAFHNCRNLTRATVSQRVMADGLYKFFSMAYAEWSGIYGASWFPFEGFEEIGESSVCWLPSPLQHLILDSTVSAINENAFEWTGNLTTIEVAAGNGHYMVSPADGCLYDIDQKTLLFCPRNKTSIVVPNGVTNIGNYAFAYCANLESVKLPETVKAIGENAFFGCRKLFANSMVNGCAYDLKQSAGDRAIATVTVSGDTAIDSFVLKDGKVYDSVLRIVNTSGSAARLTLPSGYTYETFRGAAPLTIPANSRNILTITRTADNVFLVTREELETVQ